MTATWKERFIMIMIVTGSTGGIGSCLVKKALQSHKIEKIYCLYRNESKFHDQGYADNPKIVPVRHDASEPEGVVQFMQDLDKIHCESVVCIHTAFCIEPILRVGTYLPEDIKKNTAVNIMDMVFLMNGLLQLIHTRAIKLKIINIDSGAADKPLEGWGMYCASKAYTNMFLKTVQMENHGVKIVSYEPGVVDTPMQKEIRNTDNLICGQAEIFRSYYDKGMLRSPDAVAQDIFERFIEGWNAKHFREGYKTE